MDQQDSYGKAEWCWKLDEDSKWYYGQWRNVSAKDANKEVWLSKGIDDISI